MSGQGRIEKFQLGGGGGGAYYGNGNYFNEKPLKNTSHQSKI